MLARLGWILGCGVAGLSASFGLTALAGALFGPLYESEADMTRNVFAFVCASVVLTLAGGVLGNGAYRSRSALRNPSSNDVPAKRSNK